MVEEEIAVDYMEDAVCVVEAVDLCYLWERKRIERGGRVGRRAGEACRLKLQGAQYRANSSGGFDHTAPTETWGILLAFPEDFTALENMSESFSGITIERLENGEEDADDEGNARVVVGSVPVPGRLRE